MTLSEALKDFIGQVPGAVPVLHCEVVDDQVGDAIVIRDAGSWDNDPSGSWKHPIREVSVRSKDQDTADALSIALYEALNVGRWLQLAPDYKAMRSTVPSPPESEGRDEANRWVRRFEINFLLHAAAAL